MFFRAIARPLLASWFVYGAIESIIEPERRALRSAPVIEPVLAEAGLEDVKVTDLVKAHGAVTIAAASVMALSRAPKTASLALAGLAAVTAVAGRPFWREEDVEVRLRERERFVINVSFLGAALLAATAGHSAHHKARAKSKKVKAHNKAAAAKASNKAQKVAKSSKFKKSLSKTRGK